MRNTIKTRKIYSTEMKKTTEELLNDIKSTDSIDDYLNDNKENFDTLSLADYLNSMLKKHGVDKAQVFRRAEMSGNNYGYEMFQNDKKNISRDKIIQVCMGFPMTLEETQHALRCGKAAPLDPRSRRDSILMLAIHKSMSVIETNEMLDSHKEALLC